MPDSITTTDAAVVVELTPVGRAAVAVVLVAGLEAVLAVDACFRPVNGKRFADARVDRIVLGRWGDADGEELIGCWRPNGTVEIHCHGGVAAVRNVIDRLTAHGCRPMGWPDWVRQSVADPIRAAAQIALADAPTTRTAGILLDQIHGALATTVRTVTDSAATGVWADVIQNIDAVLAHRGLGGHLTTPWRVVLAGRPNVGKSSLMNALAGFQRAIVCAEPGTTRDVVTITTAIDGWPVQLADTAGLRETTDAIESAGVARATAALADADLVLLIDDATNLHPENKLTLPPGKPVLSVLNKVDLLATPRAPAAHDNWDLFTSAVTGDGIAALVAAIGSAPVPSPPPAGAAVPFTPEQFAALDAARAAAEKRDGAALEMCLRRLFISRA